MVRRIFLFFALTIVSILSIGQFVISDDTVICDPTSVTLSVLSAPSYGTSAYTFDIIPYSPEEYAGTSITLTDDSYGGPYSIGFTFCFMGNSYTQFYIGSNGWVSFGGAGALTTTYTSATIPSTAASVPKNCIMGPWQDWHPGIAGGPYIKYQTIGTAPYRKLVVSFDNIPMYSCTTTYGKFQIVLHETTNIIENHITNKDYCAWAGGTATQGTHSLSGTEAYVYPGRNSTVWTADEESVRFTPTGVFWTTLGGVTPIAVGDTAVVTPGTTTTYVASLEDCDGSVFTDTVTVVVGIDNADFSYGAAAFCPDGTITPTFIEAPGGTFTIEPDLITINSSTGEINIEDAPAGSYSIEYITPPEPCSDSHIETITIVAYPDATIAYPDTIYCAIGSTTPSLITTPGGTFSIAPAGGATINATTGVVNLSSASIGTTYTVTYITSGLCQSTSTFSFYIRPFDDASFAYDADSYCPSGTTSPISIAVVGGTFTVTPATLDIDAVTGEIDLSTGVSGTNYFITYTTDGGACSSSETVTVYIDPLDVATFSYGGSLFCAGGTISPISVATPGGTFASSPSTLVVNASTGAIDLTTGTVGAAYNITYTTPAGPCQNSSTISITIDANDDSSFAYLDYTYCPVGSTSPITVATPGGTYTITPSGLGINAATGTLDLGTAIPGTYVVTYTTPTGLCTSSSEKAITVEPFTDAYFYYDSIGYCNYGNITPYIMNPGGSFITSPALSLNTTTGDINLLASTPGGPYPIYYNSPGCTEQDTFFITVYPDPVLTIDFTPLVCIENAPVLLSATPTGGFFSGDGVSGSFFNPANISSEGTYAITYTYTDANGCVNDITDIIQVVEHSVFAGIDISIIESNIIQLDADGGIIFEWSPGDGLSCTGCENPAAQPAATTTYTVTSFDENGCIATDDVTITVVPFDDITVFVPNAFTPNGDGMNDYLFAFGSDITEIISFTIYDRWGNVVWQGRNISPDAVTSGWDGMINGNPGQTGVYAYIVEAALSFGVAKMVSGNTTLLR